MLKNRELPEEHEEVSVGAASAALFTAEPIDYNPALPIETFDFIVTDDVHRSIDKLWRRMLDNFAGSETGRTSVRPKGGGTWICWRQFGKGNAFARKITSRL